MSNVNHKQELLDLKAALTIFVATFKVRVHFGCQRICLTLLDTYPLCPEGVLAGVISCKIQGCMPGKHDVEP